MVIVSYNASSYLKDCLDSIISLTKGPSYEIIVVDNNSADDSVAAARSFGKAVTVIANKDNRGFGAGINIGLKKVTGKYVLVLNPDIRFFDDAISKMLAWMDGHKDVGLASCQFLNGEQKLLPNGGYFPTLLRLFFWAFFLDDLPIFANLLKSYHPSGSPLLKRENVFSKDFFPDWVTGGFMFVRREVIDQVGNLDENIFMYEEEVEWQYRMRLAGWKIGYTTVTRVIHFERGSQEGSSRGAVLGEFKGLRYIYGKHFPGWKQVVVGTILDIAAFNRVFFWLVRRKMDMVKVYAEALML